MRNIKKVFVLSVVLLSIGAAIIAVSYHPERALALAPGDSDYIAIENTLRTYLEIKAEAEYTLDDSRLPEVIANDRRGGLVGGEDINKYYLQSVQWYKGNADLKGDQIGYLDVWQAVFAFRRECKRMYDEAMAQGRITVLTREEIFALEYNPENAPPGLSKEEILAQIDPTAYATNEWISSPEAEALLAQTGFNYISLPPPQSEQIVPDFYRIDSITVEKDVAHVIGDFSYAKVELTFVKIDDRWYLVGERELQAHGA
jgi:hypothetical protein